MTRQERSQHRRSAIKLKATIMLNNRKIKCIGQVRNMSTGGVFIEMSGLLPTEFDSISVQFALPNSRA